MNLNIMMDGSTYPGGWHPCDDYMKPDFSDDAKPFTRTQRPPKYFLIDFGISGRIKPAPPTRYDPLKESKHVVGTLHWASLNAHDGIGGC